MENKQRESKPPAVTEAVESFECWCGRTKYRGQPLCAKCYALLDEQMRADLRTRAGVARAYWEIVAFLKHYVRPKHAVPPKPQPKKPTPIRPPLSGGAAYPD